MMSEKNFESKVKHFLKENGAWFVKFFANRMTKVGVPDLLVCLNGRFIGIEVKAANGRPSDLQVWNIEKIRQAGGYAFVLYPSAWDDFKKFIYELSAGGQTDFLNIPKVWK